jgi:hypothetical protein
VGPAGRVVAYQHLGGKAGGRARLSRDEATALAEQARANLPALDGDWWLTGATSEKHKSRLDWKLTFTRSDLHIPSWPGVLGPERAQAQLNVQIRGSRVEAVNPHLAVPQGWAHEQQETNQIKFVARRIAIVFGLWPLAGLAVLVCVLGLMRRDLRWRTVAALAVIMVLIEAVSVVNGLPVNLGSYNGRLSVASYLIADNWLSVLHSLWHIVLFGIAGEWVYRHRFPRLLSLDASWSWRGLMSRSGAVALALGALVSVLDGTFQTLYFLLGVPIGFWDQADTVYENVYNLLLPWVEPLHEAFDSAVGEDFTYRLFGISMLSLLIVRFSKRDRLSRWLAILFTAVAWGFLHTTYSHNPFFVRGVEVSVVGLVVGWLMVRYGILAPLAAHFTWNAFGTAYDIGLAGWPWTAALGYGIAAVPLAVAVIALVRARMRGGFVSEAGLSNEDLTSALDAEWALGSRRWPLSERLGRAPGAGLVRWMVRPFGRLRQWLTGTGGGFVPAPVLVLPIAALAPSTTAIGDARGEPTALRPAGPGQAGPDRERLSA